jgi:hypothetical protein
MERTVKPLLKDIIMAQNKKIKYTKMTAEALADLINEKMKTLDYTVIENVSIPSKMK